MRAGSILVRRVRLGGPFIVIHELPGAFMADAVRGWGDSISHHYVALGTDPFYIVGSYFNHHFIFSSYQCLGSSIAKTVPIEEEINR